LDNNYINNLKQIYTNYNNEEIDKKFLSKLKNHNIYMNCYYQRCEIYQYPIFRNEIFKKMLEFNEIIPTTNYKIEELMKLNTNDVPNDTEIVLHIRLDDFFDTHEAIHPSYYINSITELYLLDNKIKTVTIVVDFLRNNEQYYINYINNNLLGKFNIKLHQKTLFEDFNYIRYAKYIICSNSSYSWCAVYLSNAVKIIYPNNTFAHANKQILQNIDLNSDKHIVKEIKIITREDLINL